MTRKQPKLRKHSPKTANFLGDEPAPNQTKIPQIDRKNQPDPDSQVPWHCVLCQNNLVPLTWWQAPGGIIRCLRCEPPHFPTTLVTQGTKADAPLVCAVYDRPGSSQPTAEERKTWTKPRRWRWLRAGFLESRPQITAYWSDASSRGYCLRCGAETRNVSPDGFCFECQADDEL